MQDVINFYTTRDAHGYMSNFYKAKIVLDGKEWPSTEHYYQAQKSLDPVVREQIRTAPSSGEAARLGRACKVRDDWEQIKRGVMYKCVYAKFTQNPHLSFALLATGNAKLVEKTSGTVRPDSVWGDGYYGEGENWLGIILMIVRDILRVKELEMRESRLDV